MLKIDVFNHIMPPKYREALLKNSAARAYYGKVDLRPLPALYNVEDRLRLMDRYEGYVQILDITAPPVEDLVSPEVAAELAKIANDEMAELVNKYPDRFLTAVACLPLNNMDAALKELDRAITELGFRGVQITTTILDKPLDSPEFEPLFEKMNQYNLPILMHPRHMRSGPRAFSFDPNTAGKPGQFLAEAPFIWPYETTIAMGRLVFSGMLDKYPNLKVITHHLGGVTPYQQKRIISQETFQNSAAKFGLIKNVLEYYKMMYGDTALLGNVSALMCGYAFFGADHVLFGTDMPFENRGDSLVGDIIRAVEEMAISEEDRRKIFEGNARKLFHIPIT